MTQHSALIDWLLESGIPTIRYLTLTRLMDLPTGDTHTQKAQKAIMETGPVPAILAHQTETGAWSGESSYYTPKYRSTHWSLTLLTELHTDGHDDRFQRGVDFMLSRMGDVIERDLAQGKTGFSCFWGNFLRYAFHTGRGNDPIIQTTLQYAIQDVFTGCRCQHNWQRACGWGVSRTLWGLAAVPPEDRSQTLQEAIDYGVNFLLEQHSLVDADYPINEEKSKINPLWFRLNFPLFYQADILFTLRVLADLGALNQQGAQPALDWLQQKRQKNGRWRGASPYRSRTWSEIGDKTETGRWVSLFSAIVLKEADLWK